MPVPVALMDPLFVLSLLGLLSMTFASSGVVPLPVSVAVLGLGFWGHPWWVIAVSTLGSILGWWVMGNALARHVPEKALLTAQNSTPVWLKRFTARFPNTSLLIINALPMPWDPIRLILLAHGSRPNSLLLPIAIGRLVRYGMIVWLGQAIDRISTLAGTVLAIIMLPITFKIIGQLWQHRREMRQNTAFTAANDFVDASTS